MAKLSVQLLHNLNGGSSNTADGCVVVFGDNFSKALGPEDSYKFSNLDENLAINCGGTSLSIEGRPTIIDYDTIPLRLWQYRDTNYFFKFIGKSFSQTTVAVLKDNYLQQDQPINLADTTFVQFSLTSDVASYDTNRFCIVFKPASTLPLHFTLTRAFQKDKGVMVEWAIGDEAGIDHYTVEKSVNGVQYTAVTDITSGAVSKTYSWLDKNPSEKNYYRVKSLSRNSQASYSQVMKVNLVKDQSIVTVYPNPVKGNEIGLLFTNVGKGAYYLKLYNTNGQQVYSSTINKANGGSGYQSVKINSFVPKGVYRMNISNGSANYGSTIVID